MTDYNDLLFSARETIMDYDMDDPGQAAQVETICRFVAKVCEMNIVEAYHRIMTYTAYHNITNEPIDFQALHGIRRSSGRYPWGSGSGKVEETKPDTDDTTAVFHDVLMVAFDITAPSAEKAHQWLQSKMPSCYGHEDLDQGITLDAWWVANDERFDGSDTDSAVFVRKGEQSNARVKLRQYGLVD